MLFFKMNGFFFSSQSYEWIFVHKIQNNIFDKLWPCDEIANTLSLPCGCYFSKIRWQYDDNIYKIVLRSIYVTMSMLWKEMGIRLPRSNHLKRRAHLESSSSPNAEGVPNNNQMEWGLWHCCRWGGLDKDRKTILNRIVVRVQCFIKFLYKAVFISRRAKYKTYCPLDNQWIILSTSKAFNYFQTRSIEYLIILS